MCACVCACLCYMYVCLSVVCTPVCTGCTPIKREESISPTGKSIFTLSLPTSLDHKFTPTHAFPFNIFIGIFTKRTVGSKMLQFDVYLVFVPDVPIAS